MYILQCANSLYYVGSTNDLKLRIREHQDGFGANFTSKNLPVKLVYFEEFDSLEAAFLREKQLQGWSRKKKEALIYGHESDLHVFASCKNKTHFRNFEKSEDQ
jgi:putative endonuclease